MKIDFPGGKKVRAAYKDHIIETDQSPATGGEGLHPSPFDLFKASLGTCMGAYVMLFCEERNIPLDCVSIDMQFEGDGTIENVNTQINVDERFPSKYYRALVKATESCKVKRQLKSSPVFMTTVNPKADR